jgi:hypothetical protein
MNKWFGMVSLGADRLSQGTPIIAGGTEPLHDEAEVVPRLPS